MLQISLINFAGVINPIRVITDKYMYKRSLPLFNRFIRARSKFMTNCGILYFSSGMKKNLAL